MNPIDITNKTFGKLTAIKPNGESKKGSIIWECQCLCGRLTYVPTYKLRSGHTKSCGCLIGESAHKRFYKHGNSITFAGYSYLYNTWLAIRKRTTNSKDQDYKYYGAKKIKMYSKWKDFKLFKKYIECILGPRPTNKHSLDRINCNKDYEPKNLRWATRAEQRRNTGANRKYAKIHSKYKGVLWNNNKWRARITYNGTAIHLGYFDTEEDAAIAYNKAAQKYFKAFAYLNII